MENDEVEEAAWKQRERTLLNGGSMLQLPSLTYALYWVRLWEKSTDDDLLFAGLVTLAAWLFAYRLVESVMVVVARSATAHSPKKFGVFVKVRQIYRVVDYWTKLTQF